MILTRTISANGPRLLALTAAAWLTATGAHAVLVAPNTPFSPGQAIGAGTTILATGSLAGTVLADQTVPFGESMGGFFTGTLRSVVVQRSDTSELDFYLQILNTTPVFDDSGIYAVALDNFAGFGFASDALEMTYRTDGLAGLTLLPSAPTFTAGTVGLNFAYRQGSPSNGAGFIFADDTGIPMFNPDNLVKDQTSQFMVIRTSATAYSAVPALVLGDFGTAITNSYGPVPEPGTAALMGIGALGFGLRRRRMAR